MTRLFTIALFLFVAFAGYSQAYKGLQRLDVDSSLAPFYHGVASGDPLADRVIIWTRVTTQQTGTINVKWRVATDTTFQTIVRADSTTTDSAKDYTVKVDVTGLQPNTWYYYQFEALGRRSLTGRMKTVPDSTANVDHLRLAVVSCSKYQNGYFNAYESISKRNDIDAVVDLGDYIYEYGPDANKPNRPVEPTHETVTLEDYYARYAHYHLDPQLRALHQQYCFITIWDDHETANDSWVGGAENHDPATEGDWNVRKQNGKDAYFHWMPIRDHAAPNTEQIYRAKYYGNLAEFIYLDTRLEGREEQSQDSSVIVDTNRTILGATQRDWFFDRLHDQGTRWKIIAQQIMVAPILIGGQILNPDQWDDYPADRKRMYDVILKDSIKNVAVLTGDIHCAWANNLRYDGETGDSVGVEFVTTSITSEGLSGFNAITPQFVMGQLPHVKYVNLVKHGYSILDITNAKTQNDYYVVSTIDSLGATTTLDASWYANNNEPFLRQASAAAVGYATPLPAKAPDHVQVFTGINSPVDPQDVVILGTYPNPTDGAMLIQYFQANEGNAFIQVVDLAGKVVLDKQIAGQKGVNYTQITLNNLASGNYVLMLTDGHNKYTKLISKGK